MEIFLRDPAGVVPKGVPPDKRVGAWPSVQEKTTGIGNVGKSPCGGTNDAPVKPAPSFSFGVV